VVDGLAARACIALLFGVRGLADEAETVLLEPIIAADHAPRLLQDEADQAAWLDALAKATARAMSHPVVGGRCAAS
jgi:hypothetical protein